jgi:hypothetical protein
LQAAAGHHRLKRFGDGQAFGTREDDRRYTTSQFNQVTRVTKVTSATGAGWVAGVGSIFRGAATVAGG